MFTKQHPVNLDSVSTAAVLAAHDQELTSVYQEHQNISTDFAGTTPPQFPVLNARWLDTSTQILKRWNGSAWVAENVASADKLNHALTIDGNSFDGSSALSVSTLMFRNKLINGNFAINQDTVSGTVTLAAGVYGHDGWKAGASGCTYTFATVNNVTTLTITAGSLLQIIEGINLQSGAHILSWQGTAQGKIGSGSFSTSGVTGTATGGTNMTVEFNTGTLSNVQLESGTVVTTFENRPVPIESILCKKYYRIVRNNMQQYGLAGLTLAVSQTLDVPMRISPTIGTITTLYSLNRNSVHVSADAKTVIHSAVATSNGIIASDISFALDARL